jgi:transposase
VIEAAQLKQLDAQQLREVVGSLMGRVASQQAEIGRRDEAIARREREIAFKQATIDKLTHEMAVLKRLKFAATSERFNAEQQNLLQDDIEADLQAMQRELEQLAPAPKSDGDRQRPKRQALPAHLPRREVHHEPENTLCACGCALKRIGEDVAEKLDYEPGVFTVERHVRGKWVCAQCHTLVQKPVPAQIIDKGIPTAGLLAQVLVGKYIDHQPLYRQENIFARAGFAIPRSSLAQWVGECGVQLQPLVDALKDELLTHSVLHADETPVAMLKPGNGKTHRAYIWSYCTTAFESKQIVVFDFAETRAGKHACAFLGHPGQKPWRGTLTCDDFKGYDALFRQGVTESGCLAHARRKFFDLWANHKSQVAEVALKFFIQLYEVEREVKQLDAAQRRLIRLDKAKPVADALYTWMVAQRQLVPEGTAIAKALNYSLKRWAALTHYLDDGTVPVDNNWVENQIRPIALGRSNWLFAGSLRAGQRAAAVMSLVHSARINGRDPYAYLRDVLERLPTHPASRIAELMPHRWRPAASVA